MSSADYPIRSVKVTFRSVLAVRRSDPPCSCMMRRERLSPMPDPSGLVEKKGVKMFSVTSVGIAPPLLLISMTTCSAASMRERI